jgi:hypothetical protein
MTDECMFTPLQLEATGWLAMEAILLGRNFKRFNAGLPFSELSWRNGSAAQSVFSFDSLTISILFRAFRFHIGQ